MTCRTRRPRRIAQAVCPDVDAAFQMARDGEPRHRRHRSAADQQPHRLGREAEKVAEPLQDLTLDMDRRMIAARATRFMAAASASANTPITAGGELTQPQKRG